MASSMRSTSDRVPPRSDGYLVGDLSRSHGVFSVLEQRSWCMNAFSRRSYCADSLYAKQKKRSLHHLYICLRQLSVKLSMLKTPSCLKRWPHQMHSKHFGLPLSASLQSYAGSILIVVYLGICWACIIQIKIKTEIL